MAVSECGDQSASNEVEENEKCGQHLRITVCANQGGRKYMEDRVHIECVRLPDGSVDYTYVAVYDGHGGAEASEFVRQHLLKNIQEQAGFNGDDQQMLQAIKSGFVETHLAMWKVVSDWPLTASGYTSTAGTTASCAFIRRGKVFTGHVGDSAIILGRRTEENFVRGSCLTVDHKPDSTEEERRINNAGGMVMKKSGVMRVVWTRPIRGHVGPVRRSTPTESIAFLAVARALGDLWSYNRDTNQFIVSPEPDVNVFTLDSNDVCLILGSDGLTNVLKPQNIVDIVMSYEQDGCDEVGRVPNHSRWLLRYALRGWGPLRADNISVVTVMFDDPRSESREIIAPSMVQSVEANMNIDKVLTEHQTSLIRITPTSCEEILTIPVELIYTGALDQNFNNDVNYSGPGFTKHGAVPNGVLPVAHRFPYPSVPLSTSTTRHFSQLTTISNYFSHVTGTTQSYATDVTESYSTSQCVAVSHQSEVVSSLSVHVDDDSAQSESSLSPNDSVAEASDSSSGNQSSLGNKCDTNSVRKRRTNAHFGDGVTVGTMKTKVLPVDPETGTPVKYFCKKHGLRCSKVKKRNEEYAASRISSVSCCELIEADEGPVEVGENEGCSVSVSTSASFSPPAPKSSSKKDVLDEHAYASSSSRPIAVVSPITTTPTSTGRRRLIASRRTSYSQRRRGPMRRNLLAEGMLGMTSEDDTELVTLEDSEEYNNGEDFEYSGASLTNVRKGILMTSEKGSPSPPVNRRRSYGGASALSPIIMLAALRTPDRIGGLNDPLQRDVSLSALRAARARSSISSSSLSPLKKLKLSDEATLAKPRQCQLMKETVQSPGSAQKRKAQESCAASVLAEPPPKRSRIWGFISNIIGGGSHK